MSLEQHRVEQLQGLLAKIQHNASLLAAQRAQASRTVAASAVPAASASAGTARKTPSLRPDSQPQPSRPSSLRPSEPTARRVDSSVPAPRPPSMQPPPAVAVTDLDETQSLDDDLLMTIPPSAPPEASDPDDTGEFELPPAAAAPGQFHGTAEADTAEVDTAEADTAEADTAEADTAEADSAVTDSALADDDEPPPISTQQQRGEDQGHDEFEESLGFGEPHSDEDEDDFAATSPRTPPPESGPQVTIPPKEAKESEAPAAGSSRGPTMEQLGSTIDLDDADAAELELADAHLESQQAISDGEAELPGGEFAGGFDASLRPPDSVSDDLRAHDHAERERAERHSLPPEVSSAPPTPKASADAGPSGVVARPPVVASAPAALYDRSSPQPEPRTFLERLDAALELGTG